MQSIKLIVILCYRELYFCEVTNLRILAKRSHELFRTVFLPDYRCCFCHT